MEANFSTSEFVEKAASHICLMHSLEKYFEYKMMMCICGITKINLLGEKDDWCKIIKKLDKLKPIILKDYWIDELKAIINEFINVYDGKINKEFWEKSIYVIDPEK